MNPVPPLTISPVLREAANLRIEELEQVKQSFKRRFHLNPTSSFEQDAGSRLTKLLGDVKLLGSDLEFDDRELNVESIARYLEQAQDDKCVTQSKLLKYEWQIWEGLRKCLNRMEVASLHVDLMKEAMDATLQTEPRAANSAPAAIDDDFELIESELDDVFESFEARTFGETSVDSCAIETYLSSLFEDQIHHQWLERLRGDMKICGDELLQHGLKVDQDGMMQTILDLLKNDLVSADKKRILEGYLQSPIALREIVALVKTRSFCNWKYKDAEKGLPITARRDIDGQFSTIIEEDVIDMLFLNCTALVWGTKLKACLTQFATCGNLFGCEALTAEEKSKREYYLEHRRPRSKKYRDRACTVCQSFYTPGSMPPSPPMQPMQPMPPMPPAYYPPPPMQLGSVPPMFDINSIPSMLPPPPPPPPFLGDGTVTDERRCNYYVRLFMSRLPKSDGNSVAKVTPPEVVQGEVIKTLAVEAMFRATFDGEAHAFSAKFDSLAATLPHKSIITVLGFLGVPSAFLDFFTRFLEVRLDMGLAAPGRVLNRRRGVPDGHGLETFFSESILFFLELAVHRKTGNFVYRTFDQLHFIGTRDQQQAAKEETSRFAVTMGLKLNQIRSTEMLRIGFLVMQNGTSNFEIDDTKVATYAYRIKKRLDACTTLLAWVRVWNSTIGTYAAHLFGPLANVLGKSHLDAVRATYNRMFDIIFDNGDLTTHVKQLLRIHSTLNFNDVVFAPEAIIYLPQAYGGLGVKNPMITLNLAHNVAENPSAPVRKYLQAEKAYYTGASQNYARFSIAQHQQKLEELYDEHPSCIAAALGPEYNLATFMTEAELTRYREQAIYPTAAYSKRLDSLYAPSLVSVYYELLNESVHHIEPSAKVSEDIRRLSDGDKASWAKLSGEDRWVLQMYSNECFEKYGSLEIWWAEGMPIEVYKTLRGHVWNEGDDDDDSGA